MNIEKMTNVQVEHYYALKISEVDQILQVGREKSMIDAVVLAFNAGWQRRENKARNDRKRAAH